MAENVLEQFRRLWGLKRRRGSGYRAGPLKGKTDGEGGRGAWRRPTLPSCLAAKDPGSSLRMVPL